MTIASIHSSNTLICSGIESFIILFDSLVIKVIGKHAWRYVPRSPVVSLLTSGF